MLNLRWMRLPAEQKISAAFCPVFTSLKYEKKTEQQNNFNQMIEIARTVAHFIGRISIGHNVIFDISNKLISEKSMLFTRILLIE